MLGFWHPAPTQTLPFPRIIFSTPLAIIAYFLIWFVPDFPQGQALWYLLFYCLFETLVTVSVGTSPGCLGGGMRAVPGARRVGARSHICLSIV